MPVVTMLRGITGTRNGVPWPGPGGTMDVSAGEAERLVLAGHAETGGGKQSADPVPERDVEPAEKATPVAKSGRKTSARRQGGKS